MKPDNEIKTFGVLCDSFFIKKWQYDCIEKILAATNYKLTLIVINKSAGKTEFSFNHLFFLVFKKLFVRLNIARTQDLRELANDYKKQNVEVNRKGRFSEYFKEEDVNQIKSYNLDFMLRFGFGIIRGDILDSTKYGIWSFHHGDEQKYRGGPYCFWEIYNNEPNTCAVLQKLTNKLDGGIILKKGYFKTQSHSFAGNINQTLSLSTDWPTLICKQIENNSFELPLSDAQTSSKIHLLPSNFKMIIFILKLLRNKIKHFYIKYLTFDFWHVGYLNKNISDVTSSDIKNSDVHWLKQSSSNYFLADPFLYKKNGKPLIALEYLPYKGFKGEIKAFSGDDFELEEKEYNIIENHHLSFPNTFEDNGITYCLPESFEANNLYLYEKRNNEWEKHLIIKDLKCIDPEIVFHEGHYYLFTTLKGCNHETKLFIYYSKDLLCGWQPHLLNPVVFDVRSARAAGKVFKKDGILYRPGQNYSIHKEGSVTVSRIHKISPTEYSEEIVSYLNPISDSKYSDKIHTINCANDLTVIDACKIKSLLFRPDILFHIIKSKI